MRERGRSGQEGRVVAAPGAAEIDADESQGPVRGSPSALPVLVPPPPPPASARPSSYCLADEDYQVAGEGRSDTLSVEV